MILVDSTKYISWMRAGRNPAVLLAPQVQSGTLVSCGIIRIEVLRGIIKPAAKAELAELFDLIPEVALTGVLLHEAAELAWTLDRQGAVLPVTDLLISACARRAKATVITEDPHFGRIPALPVRAELD
jgi:predicted nucleic acid-binding protein